MSLVKHLYITWWRKIAVILIAAVMALSCALPSFAVTYGAIGDLQDLNIIDDVPLEELRLNDSVTRAEFSKLIVRLMNLQDVPHDGNTRFSDVFPEHWASGYISVCAALGIFEGTGNGRFEPDSAVILQDVLKTIVTVLGYQIRAEADGGYPEGYLKQAAALRLTKGIDHPYTEAASRAEVFQISANALDVDMLSTDHYDGNSDNRYAVRRGDTLRGLLMEAKDLFTGIGVVTATYNAYLVGENSAIKEDEVEIDGQRFKAGKTGAVALLGAKVAYTAVEDESSGIHTLVSVNLHKDVDYLELTDEEFEAYGNYTVSYCLNGAGRSEEARISSTAVLLYNNRPVFDWGHFTLQNGIIRMYDNDRDGRFDVVLIEDYISVLVENVNTSNRLIRFAGPYIYTDPVTNQAASLISLDDRDGAFQADIRSDDGNKVAFEKIQPGMLVSLFTSLDGHFRKAVVSGKAVEGTLEELGENTCVVDNVTYQLENKELSYLSKDGASVGSAIRASINFAGKVGYIELLEDENEKFGYIAGQEKKGLGAEYIQIVFAGTIEEDKDNDPETTDDITKYLVARNDSIQEKKLSDKLVLDGKRVNAGELLPERVPLKFKLNSQGEILRISTLTNEILPENKVYNAAEKVFGNTMGTPFGFNDGTRALCIPGNTVSNENDYLAEVRMENGQSYLVSGFEYDEDAKCDVKLFSVTQKMVYEEEPAIGYRTKFAVVANTSKILNEENNEVTKITLLTEGVKKSMLVAEYTPADVDRLKMGDVIYYSQNARREFVDYTLIAELSDDSDSYLSGSNTDDERAFGLLTGLEYDKIEGLRMWRVHKLELLIDNPAVYNLRVNNAPPVYVYDRVKKTVSLGSVDDFRMNSDRVFVHVKSNVPQGFVIVRDRKA